jgi:hypothetical protein
VAFAKISLAQVIVAGETKMFARADVSGFAHRRRVRRSIRGNASRPLAARAKIKLHIFGARAL